jgi:hypothetical protein
VVGRQYVAEGGGGRLSSERVRRWLIKRSALSAHSGHRQPSAGAIFGTTARAVTGSPPSEANYHQTKNWPLRRSSA